MQNKKDMQNNFLSQTSISIQVSPHSTIENSLIPSETIESMFLSEEVFRTLNIVHYFAILCAIHNCVQLYSIVSAIVRYPHISLLFLIEHYCLNL